MKGKRHIFYYLYLSAIGVFIYLMNVLTPFYSDDWYYHLISGTTTPIASFTDILHSQYIHYFDINGRFIPHFFIQLFDGLLGKTAFHVVNSLVFIIFLYLISYLLHRQYKSYILSTSLALTLMCFLLPGFGYCFLWMSGACNYLWASTLVLLFIIAMETEFKRPCLYPLLFLFGVVSGWTNEAISIGVGIGYFVYFFFHRKALRLSRVILLSGFYVGILFLVFSPGSIHRALGQGHLTLGLSDTVHNIGSALLKMDNTRFLPLLAGSLLIMTVFNKGKARTFIKSNIMETTAIAVTFLFVLWTKHETGHSRFGFELFSLLLVLKLVAGFQWVRKTFWLLQVLLLCLAVSVLTLAYRNDKDYQNCLSQIKSPNASMILTDAVECHPFFERFIIHFSVSDMNTCHYEPRDPFINMHFCNDRLFFIPRKFYERLSSNPDDFQTFTTMDHIPFYAKKIGEIPIGKVRILLNETDEHEIPFLIRPFAHSLTRYNTTEIKTFMYSVVRIEGENYILVNKLPMVDHRLREIIVE